MGSEAAREGRVPPLTAARLRRMPLPRVDEEGDKEQRGRVVVAGGSREVPGSLLLAASAALRAGAGKLQIAAPGALALHLGVAIPESRVFPLPESDEGGIDPSAAERIAERAERARALLLGPGLLDPDAARALTREVLRRLRHCSVVLDAGALPALDEPGLLRHLEGRVAITPHAGEMARILGGDEAEIAADRVGAARRAASRLGAVVALKGPETVVAAPDGRTIRYTGGRVGLATSGSGDVLAGAIAGLLARGAEPFRAVCWGVYAHGAAGNALTRRVGPLGFLAREIATELPGVLERLGGSASKAGGALPAGRGSASFDAEGE